MVKEKNYLSSTLEKFNIDAFADLTILDLITLELLLKKQEPIIRYSLYVEIKEFFKENKDIPTSSFYNNLINLNKKGFISFSHSKDKKIKTDLIEATQLAKDAIKSVNSYFMSALVHNANIGNEQVLELMGQDHFEKGLMVSMSDFLNLDLFPFLSKKVDKLYILTRKEVYKDLIELGFQNFELSKIDDGNIREPENFFDVSIIPFYFRNPENYRITRTKLLKELIRVTKPDGWIVISSRAKLPTTQNYFANEVLRIYGEALDNRTFTINELQQDMKKAGIKEIKTLEYQGMVAAIGKKSLKLNSK
ncbi:MAG: hypothetical protein EU532_02065 [Promethearchaeota archaeon]|nr:MAG: hypothetical protein EU532_02065 [Candidatus Lokiarchaeota archaeon]